MAELCPDCRRPVTHPGSGVRCIIRGGDACIRVERDRLKAELDAVEKLKAHLERGAQLLMEILEQQDPPMTEGRQLRRSCADEAWLDAERARLDVKEVSRG